ncbi:tenascin-like isoform X7 [Pieris brassicae]|uniref:tenascin-like isoform X7 n=1 Tax=Pieris brassicae TaxID=7116 RepID=UPI001E661192|nr:tenascin-like isoform X7 [Pieris brassicae]
MVLNLLVFVSIIYCTSAYVTVTVYEEGQDTLSQKFSHCEYHDCNNFCERLGYQSGTCVDGHCKCNYKQADDAIILKACSPATCNQMCQRMGFPGGDCINNNRCECQKFVDKPETDSSSLRSCNLRACEQLCRRLGFPSGACVDDRCKCDNFLVSKNIADIENNNDVSFDTGDMDVNPLRSCNLRACEQLCRRLGFPGGACVGDRCKCDNFLESENIADTENKNDVSLDAGDMDVNPLRRCHLQACEQLCRRLGFHGVCVGDRCKCDNFRTSKDEYSEDASTLRDCNYQECDQRCRRLGFPGGACVGSRCKCDNFRSTQFIRGLDSAKINTEYRSCNYRECDRRCRRLKFPGGACVNNRCKCDNFLQLLSNEESSATNTTYNPLENDVKCDSTQCKTSCSERGLHNGICIERECYCDMEDAETSSLPCEPHACNVTCQVMKRLGGFCLLGKCICY